MAVTMNEMNVEVQPPAAPVATATTKSGAEKKEIDMHQALEMMRERRHRLCAD